MARNKTRTPQQREQQLARVAAGYLCGMSQVELAREAGVTPQQIRYDLKILQARWTAASLHDIGEAKALQLAKLDNLEREYWAGYARSMQKRTEESTAEAETPTGRTTRKLSKVRERDGNPDFLTGVLSCIQQRSVVLGLNAPARYDVRHDLTAYARARARDFGLEEADALADVEALLREHRLL